MRTLYAEPFAIQPHLPVHGIVAVRLRDDDGQEIVATCLVHGASVLPLFLGRRCAVDTVETTDPAGHAVSQIVRIVEDR